MACDSCKKKEKLVEQITGISSAQELAEKQPIGMRIATFLAKLVIWALAVSIGSIIVIPFTIYALTKAIFGDGRLQMDATIRTLMRNSGSNLKESIKDRFDIEDDEPDAFNLEEQEITTYQN